MAPHSEGRGEDAVRHRITQQERVNALAFRIIIVDVTLLVLEAIEARFLPIDICVEEEKLGSCRSPAVPVGRGKEDFEPIGGLHLRLEINDRCQQPDDPGDHRFTHAVGKAGAIDAIIQIRKIALDDGRHRRVVEGVRYGRRWRRRRADDEAATVVARNGDDVIPVGIHTGAHDAHITVGLFDTEAQDVALRQ